MKRSLVGHRRIANSKPRWVNWKPACRRPRLRRPCGTPTSIARSKPGMLYQTFLGRAPSYSERLAAIQSLQSGTSEIALSVGLVNSAEYQASHPTPGTLVAGLYENILNEVPDASTQLQAAGALANESVGDLALSLMTSTAGLTHDRQPGIPVDPAPLGLAERSSELGRATSRQPGHLGPDADRSAGFAGVLPVGGEVHGEVVASQSRDRVRHRGAENSPLPMST